MANKTFNTRIKNKRDTAANWEKVATTFQPLDGELIVVDTAAGKTRFKVGRYDSSKDRLLYYNEIPFTDEYLYNDLNESQGKIYDTLSGLDERTFIESTLEPSFDNTTYCTYNIGLWQFPKSGFYKIKLSKLGTKNTNLAIFARQTKDDGTTPEDFDSGNRAFVTMLGSGDGKVEYIFALVDYIDDDAQTAFKVQFLNTLGFANYVHANVLDKTTQKWAYAGTTATKLHTLSIKKGDTTTYYDGRAAKTVEIPTKVSELTNDSFVSYAEQNLTDEQKAQAKANLGIDALVGNTTDITPAQVKEAILAGRPVVITYTDSTWGNLEFTSFGYSVEQNAVVANLAATNNNNYILAYLIGTSSGWSLQTEQLTTANELNTAIDNVSNEYVKYASAQTLTDDQKSQARTNIGAMENVIAGPNTLGGVQPYFWMYSDNTPRVDVRVNDEGRLLVCGAEVKGTRKVSNFCKFVNGSFSDDVFNSADYGSCIVTSLRTTGLSQSAPENLTVPLLILFGEGDRGKYPIIGFDSAGKTFKGKINSSLSSPSYEITITNEIDSEVIPNSTNAVTGNGVFELVNNFTEYVDGNYVQFAAEQTLTDEQKAQARENIGAVGESDITIFPVKISALQGGGMSNKTAKEIYDAHSAGKTVIATAANGSQYSLSIASMSSSKYQICFSAVKYDSSSTQTYLEFYYLKNALESSTARYTFYTYNFDDQYVKFTAEQTLTDDQKAQARENINAPSPADAVYTVTASSTDGVAYTATVPGIDSLTAGASFIMIPNKASTSKAPTLDVNGLGAKPIRRRLSSLTTSLQQGYSTNWIALNKPFTVVYDGTAWIVEGLTKTDGADVYGAVAQATADANGNNIVDTYATIAMLQSLLPKVTTITLTTNWTGSASPYYQDIALSCVTETSIVDLQPTPEQLASWQDEGLAFTTLSGNGTVRVYAAGGKPSSAITVQVRVQEVTVI